MKYPIIISLAVVLFSATTAYSQNEALREINAIKSQDDLYYYGQSSHHNADSARVYAINKMLTIINAGRNEDQRFTNADISPFVKYIPILRNKNTRGFAYMLKSDLPQPGNIENKTVADNDRPVESNPVTPRDFVPDMFVQGIMRQKTFQKLYRYLRALKADGQIRMFGALSEVDDYGSLCLIIIDNKSQEIVTVLSAATQDGSRTNLTTGLADSLDNYPKQMTAVIYYIK